MSRSIWKLKSFKTNLSKLLLRRRKNVWCRRSVIPKFLLNSKIFVHNGKEYRTVIVTENRLGYKFGEFSSTRQACIYKEKRKKR